MRGVDIEQAHTEVLTSIDREFRRLRQTLAEQQMKDEEERLKKIQVNCFSIRLIDFSIEILF